MTSPNTFGFERSDMFPRWWYRSHLQRRDVARNRAQVLVQDEALEHWDFIDRHFLPWLGHHRGGRCCSRAMVGLSTAMCCGWDPDVAATQAKMAYDVRIKTKDEVITWPDEHPQERNVYFHQATMQEQPDLYENKTWTVNVPFACNGVLFHKATPPTAL